MILDGHIHINQAEVNADVLSGKMTAAGVDGGILISLPPAAFVQNWGSKDPATRLDHVLALAAGRPNLYPFYWIDPTEDDALEQIHRAIDKGIRGFKVICNHFYPGDSRAMPVYRAIAETNRPLMFHSGILWDGTCSSKYNRPVEFEAMIDVPKLRFSLAHISWPWVDECLAVYGKFQNALASRKDVSCEMFIDVTPGTPPIYRREALTKIFTIGYNIADNVWFGSDSSSSWYAMDFVPSLIEGDAGIYESIGLDAAARDKVFHTNLLRFLGQQ
jgi:predicted TIM-barrel fold metal-dependent hydrolase